MIINHNLNAMSAHRNMGNKTIEQGKAMEKLSSGIRINRAGDDAAGLAISEKMRSQIRGLHQASRNAQDGISMIQTAEGALSETQAIGQRMRELAIQSANGTYIDEDRELINREFTQLRSEMDRISTDTEFNGNKVLNGSMSGKKLIPEKIEKLPEDLGIDVEESELAKLGEGNFKIDVTKDDSSNYTISIKDNSHFNGNKEYTMDSVVLPANINDSETEIQLAGIKIKFTGATFDNDPPKSSLSFQVGAHKEGEGVNLQIGANKNQSIGFSIENMRSRELGLGGVSIATVVDAQEAIKQIDNAVSRVSEERAKMGAIQNRLEHTIVSTDNTAENLQTSESRIRDVDMAKEMMNLTKLNVLQQASQAMLSQANQAPQQVLQLLK